MKIRNTVRLVLLDAADRLLLIKMENRHANSSLVTHKGAYWITIGGGIEVGESLIDAARRECFEETGLQNVTIGQVVWHGQSVLNFQGEPTLFNQTFLVARTDQTAIIRDNLNADEQSVIQEYRWWSQQELEKTTEIIIPQAIARLLPPVVAGDYAVPPVEVDLSL